MRIRLTVTVIAAATFFDMAASKAYDGPWCAQYALGLGGVVEDCRMQSFAICHQEIIGGNRGFCFPNPRWQGKSRAGGPRPRAYRKHSYN